jgi:hypothetical protein
MSVYYTKPFGESVLLDLSQSQISCIALQAIGQITPLAEHRAVTALDHILRCSS